jgi:hypothetical protein
MTFGIELEFFLLDAAGEPAMNSTMEVIRLWRLRRLPNSPVPELGSFQIELNPGPWPLSPEGIERALAELRRDVTHLNECASDLGYSVCADPLTPRISARHLAHPCLLAPDARSRATSSYFSRSQATVRFANGDIFVFPGETVLACLNEIHIHVQGADDRSTIQLFNEFNLHGPALVRDYQTPIRVNGELLDRACTTMRLFEEADGEPNLTGTLRRVGCLPDPVHSYAAYQHAVETFRPIPCAGLDPPFLNLESSVWFWTRLRGCPGSLRAEFRPMDMGPDWERRVRFLAGRARLLLDTGRFEYSQLSA